MEQRGADFVVVTLLPLPLRAEVVGHPAGAQFLENGRHGFTRVIGDIADDQTEAVAGVIAVGEVPSNFPPREKEMWREEETRVS